jgi:hypothetical protein
MYSISFREEHASFFKVEVMWGKDVAGLYTKHGAIVDTEVLSVYGQIIYFIIVRPALSVLTSHGLEKNVIPSMFTDLIFLVAFLEVSHWITGFFVACF